MKKIFFVVFLFLAVAIFGIVFIQFNKDEEPDDTTVKLGVLLNGNMYDSSWGQALVDSLSILKKEMDFEVEYVENVPASNECVDVMVDLIENDCNIIICNSYDYGDYALEVAKEYPDVYFFHATGTESGENFTSYFGRMYQMRYIAGVVAGYQSDSGHIGYVATMDIPEVIRGINAFTLGVRSVNPHAEVHVVYTTSWNDDELTEDATHELINHNPEIDVLAMHTDSLRVLEIAESKGIWSIGYNYDNSDKFPNTYLTAPVWKWENFYRDKINECIQGEFEGKHYWMGAETEIVAMAPISDNAKDYIQYHVEDILDDFKSGKFDVFYGPIYDNEGNLRVEAGESMTDEYMLNFLNWYVEGVFVESY